MYQTAFLSHCTEQVSFSESVKMYKRLGAPWDFTDSFFSMKGDVDGQMSTDAEGVLGQGSGLTTSKFLSA